MQGNLSCMFFSVTSILTSLVMMQFAFNLQPDGLHPNVEGLEKMAACILSTVEGIIGRGTMTQSNMLSTNSLKRYYDMIART